MIVSVAIVASTLISGLNNSKPVFVTENLTVTPIIIEPSPTLTITPSIIKITQVNPSPTISITPTIAPTPDSNKGPGGIAPGAYPVDSLTQEQKQWLWKFYGHEGNAPFGYGGETFVPTRVYSGSSKACFIFYGETVSEDVYNAKKPITFDASCSENATLFRWSVNGGILKYFDNLPSDSIVGEYFLKTKIVTKCLRCNSSYEPGEVNWKIKLEVVGHEKDKLYRPDSNEKTIRMKD